MKETHPFVAYLYGLAERGDRGALAELRRGFLSELAVLPHVVRFLSPDASARNESTLSLVAKLFSLHPEKGERTLASALRTIAQSSDSIDLRFRALLDCDREDLAVHLRHAVSLARAHALAIDWNDLLKTVRGWRAESHWAQRRWAREFWATTTATDSAPREDS